jgi:hypothetical protein
MPVKELNVGQQHLSCTLTTHTGSLTLLKAWLEEGVELCESASDAVPDSTGLTRVPTPTHVYVEVKCSNGLLSGVRLGQLNRDT